MMQHESNSHPITAAHSSRSHRPTGPTATAKPPQLSHRQLPSCREGSGSGRAWGRLQLQLSQGRLYQASYEGTWCIGLNR